MSVGQAVKSLGRVLFNLGIVVFAFYFAPPLTLAICLTVCAALLVLAVVQKPYMDEIFHLPQTERYCELDFLTWDPKITTPPGFHIVSALFGYVVGATRLSLKPICVLPLFRLMNFVLWGVNLSFLNRLRKKLHPQRQLDWAVSLSLLPCYWFFAFLFYTDMMSMTFLLSCYLYSLDRSQGWAAFMGLMAVSVRQTNIVWVAFFLFEAVVQSLRLPNDTSLIPALQTLLTRAWSQRGQLMEQFQPNLALLLCFVLFVWVNGGIVVGDRSAHVAVLHGAQIPYFFLFVLGWLFPISPTPIQHFRQSPLLFKVALFVTIAALFIGGRMAHPYLLADNRHLTFYLWRRVLSKDVFVYLLTPVSWISDVIVLQTLCEAKGQLWTLAFMTCTAATLVPSGLLEFRYLLPPTFVLALHLPLLERRWRVAQAVVYTAVNVAVMWLFLRAPFEWPDGTQARFIW